MKTLRTALSILFRLSGVTLVLLGLYIWSGRGAALAPIHMGIGLIFTLTYLAIVGLASRDGLALGPALLAMGWGWVVRVIHLLFGVVAMAIADRLLKGNPARGPQAAATAPGTVTS